MKLTARGDGQGRRSLCSVYVRRTIARVNANSLGLVLLAAQLGLQSSVVPAADAGFFEQLVAAAIEQTRHPARYDGSYRRIAYPGGDVPSDVGVCTDLVIRAYRGVGIDLQRLVHEDMRLAFSAYPTQGLPRPDPNIDHRRVPNLQAFLKRRGAGVPLSNHATSYRAGELVTWMLPGNLPHIGLVTAQQAPSGRPLIVHNIGRGPELEDMLLAFPVTGHYRYRGN